eukprot:gnl/TRDRNA2_/TRDRNA2_174628_c0_seq1.p1 gnl/TRDRNA2_/TRDRNA2_174628_c0~~gnl/TRDRNA2_/TRDRNA2_174628_c0_seq1.p1  ORF type:complete len:555 (+),score=79.92 gnl/TRDRNA2_/TRDRNA2_174628_c0_seq1:215-1666(+)
MVPAQTEALYGLSVGQMERREVLHHYLGQHLDAEVRPSVNSTPTVFTLRLDQHHWFFANGVRVHNKGFGGRGGRTGSVGKTGTGTGKGRPAGYGRNSHTNTRTRAHFATTHLFAAYIIMNVGSRRRYGTFKEMPGSKCIMKPENETAIVCEKTIIAHAIPGTLFDNVTKPSLNASENSCHGITCCYDCISCDSKECISSIKQCDEFLAQSFDNCTAPPARQVNDTWGPWGALVVPLVLFSAMACFMGKRWICGDDSDDDEIETWQSRRHKRELAKKPAPEVKSMSKVGRDRCTRRKQMQGSNPHRFGRLELGGAYSEEGDTKPTQYVLVVAEDGTVTGTAWDDDGEACVQGKLCWAEDCKQRSGVIMWCESRFGVDTEVEGRMMLDTDGSISIVAEYISSCNKTTGWVKLHSIHAGPTEESGACSSSSNSRAQVVMGRPMDDVAIGMPVVLGRPADEELASGAGGMSGSKPKDTTKETAKLLG